MLVLALAGDAETDQQLAQASEKFPTSAIAVLTLPRAWKELTPGNAVLATSRSRVAVRADRWSAGRPVRGLPPCRSAGGEAEGK